jgi:hypothetical protein
MAATRIETPDRTRGEPILLMHVDGTGNRQIFRVFIGKARLHGATLGEHRSKHYSALEGNACTSGRRGAGPLIPQGSEVLLRTQHAI